MFWDILVSLCVEHNITPSALTKELSIAKGVVTKWKNGSVPHHTTLLKIANFFGVTVEYLDCSVDYLLGRTDKPEVNK